MNQKDMVDAVAKMLQDFRDRRGWGEIVLIIKDGDVDLVTETKKIRPSTIKASSKQDSKA